jgi:hypothetical protein
LCKISKVYDGKSAGYLILILNLEMEIIVFNLSKYLVAVFMFFIPIVFYANDGG